MKCPRCKANLGENDMFCTQCGLDLMKYFMKEDFDTAKNKKNEEAAGAEEDSAKSVLEEVKDSYGGFGDPYGDFRNDLPFESSYENPYAGFGEDAYDPYKNITGKNEDLPESTEKTEESGYDKDPYSMKKAPEQKNIQESEEPKKTESKKEPEQEAQKQEKKKKKSKFPWILFLVAACIGSFWFGKGAGKQKQPSAPVQHTAKNPVKQNTPTPESTATPVPTATPTPTPEPSWQGAVHIDDQRKQMKRGKKLDESYLDSLMAGSGARYGVYIMDLANYNYYIAGESATPLPASALIGIPIMYTIAEGVSTNVYSLDDPVKFTYTFANGRGNMKSGQNGQYFALGEMLKEALLYSDNNALNSLIDYLTLDRINSICHQYGYESVDMQRKLMSESTSLENYICPRDAAMMLNAIYQNNFTGIGRDFLRDYFKLSPGDAANKGMYPACGSSSTFLNLNGITETRYNEVGLIENGDEVFIMAVMTVEGKQEISAPCVTNAAGYVLENLKGGR